MTETGWQADPFERHDYRYFDGASWTDLVSDGGEMSNDPLPGVSPVVPALQGTAAPQGTVPRGTAVPPAAGPVAATGSRRRLWPWLVGLAAAVGLTALVLAIGVLRWTDDGAIQEEAAVTHTVDVGQGAWAVAVAEDATWVTNLHDGSVDRLDPDDGEVTGTVDVDSTPRGVAVGDDAVWVASEGGTVTRVDPSNAEVTDTIEVDGQPSGIAVSDESVWFTDRTHDTVVRIDPDTREVTDTVELGGDPTGVAVTEDSVWATSLADHSVSRIDPETAEVTDVIEVQGSPWSVAATDDAVWVTSMDEGGCRGSTQTLAR